MRIHNLLILFLLAGCASKPAEGPPTIASLFTTLSSGRELQRLEKVPLDFHLYHPQGMVKVKDHFVLSTVEVLKWPERSDDELGPEFTPGSGRARLIKFDGAGKKRSEVTLAEQDSLRYHPGGMDFDGTHIWIAVAEYRPDSSSDIYKVDPNTLKATRAFTVKDHIGAVVFDRQKRQLHGASWGSRRLYVWDLNGRELVQHDNDDRDVDYQDCQYIQGARMLCSGLTTLIWRSEGGMALIDLKQHTHLHKISVRIYPYPQEARAVLTRNPMHAELHRGQLRLYFVPEDDTGALHIYGFGGLHGEGVSDKR